MFESYLMGILAGLTIIVGSIFLGYSSDKLKRYFYYNSFWNSIIGEDILIIISKTKETHGNRWAGLEDAIAASEIHTHLRNIGYKKNMQIIGCDEVEKEMLGKSNIITLGGPGANRVTKEILEEIKSSIEVITDERGHSIGFKEKRTENKYLVKTEDNGNRVLSEIGLLIRGPNPFCNKRKLIFLSIFGVHGFGALGVTGQLCSKNVREVVKKTGKEYYNKMVTTAVFSMDVENNRRPYAVKLEKTFHHD